MKKIITLLMTIMLLFTACGNTSDVGSTEIEKPEKKIEMTSLEVKSYMHKLTGTYSLAYTSAFTNDDKLNKLNEAITDINLAVYEIEDEYETGVPPTQELLKLAEYLLDVINYEMVDDGDKAYDSSVKAGGIIGDLSREYLDGELPWGIQKMTGKESAN